MLLRYRYGCYPACHCGSSRGPCKHGHPVLNQANTDIQKRLGVYNPDLAKAWGQYGGVMKAVAGLVGLMGAIGAITYAGSQCNPYNQTDDVKDTKLGKLSSKFESAKAEASSKK